MRAAFLSEDYEDELAEKVRNWVQGESIWDFCHMYQSLCKRWNIKEEEIKKLILKNINPQLKSQLRSVELLRVGQQLNETTRTNSSMSRESAC